MFRLATLFLLNYILFVGGLVKHIADLTGFDEFDDNDLSSVKIQPTYEIGVEKTPLWVLDLNTEDLNALKLRIGSQKEDEEFEYAVGDSIRKLERFEKLSNPRVKKDDPMKNSEDVSDYESEDAKKDNERLQSEITKVVNKFILSTNEPSDSVTEDEPSLSLYFKGPYTSLTIRSGRIQRHYFLRPPSPLPAWFNAPHQTGGDVAIPISLRNPFYVALLHLLQMFLGYPI
ncbi:uncharacterized protein LOC135082845 [Ostrinia nubilalis]|uniref:uncharacterized protein LOC135082845 n=1 Tax=Ostrinia nubilalis TaxID=29057 RepID=UPI00308234AE